MSIVPTFLCAITMAWSPFVAGCGESSRPVEVPPPSTSTSDSIGAKLKLPPGFVAQLFAAVPGARFMALGPDGAVYVSQPSPGRVMRLFDTRGTGVADQKTVAVDGLNRPHGLAFHDGWFYIANTDGVVRVKLDGNGKAIGTPMYVNHYSSGGDHWTRSLVFGADGKMYVSIGSNCNACVERNADRAAVMQYNADGTGGRLFAKGLRNAVGLAVHHPTGQIWVVQNERDNLGDKIPPEEINILQDGGDYGWPYCYGNRIPSPEFNNPARCSSTIPPALEMPAHVAPLGMAFLSNATQLPADMRDDMLVGFHGSWDSSVPVGALVARVVIENNKPVRVENFITGWQLANGSRWGRPVDVLVYKDGSLLVSDDAGGMIVRVSRATQQ